MSTSSLGKIKRSRQVTWLKDRNRMGRCKRNTHRTQRIKKRKYVLYFALCENKSHINSYKTRSKATHTKWDRRHRRLWVKMPQGILVCCDVSPISNFGSKTKCLVSGSSSVSSLLTGSSKLVCLHALSYNAVSYYESGSLAKVEFQLMLHIFPVR